MKNRVVPGTGQPGNNATSGQEKTANIPSVVPLKKPAVFCLFHRNGRGTSFGKKAQLKNRIIAKVSKEPQPERELLGMGRTSDMIPLLNELQHAGHPKLRSEVMSGTRWYFAVDRGRA